MKSMLGRLGIGLAVLGLITLNCGQAYASWSVEHVVNTNTWSGDTCSIAVDAQGRPHVAYAVAAVNFDHLYYATKVGSSWSIQLVKTNCLSGNFSRRVSISIDTNGRPHICFGGYIGGNFGVFHAYSASGTSWSFETIDGAGSGRGIDSAFDTAGRLHVSYIGSGSEGDASYYAVKSGSSWSTRSMIANGSAETSIAVDLQGFPHVAFVVSSSTSGVFGVYYATKTNTSWTISRIETNWVTMTGNPGISIAIGTNGIPNVSWLNDEQSYTRLLYATKSGASWVKETIGPAGPCAELVLKPDNTPMVAYFNRHDWPWQLLVAERNGGIWQKQAVETDTATNYLDVIYVGMALDKSINPYLAYCNNYGGGSIHNLKYAYKTGDRDSDGLVDQDEVYIYGTDPDDPDSDSDGLTDYFETITMPCLDPLDDDTDDDGVKDGQEIDDGTYPCGEVPSISGSISYSGSQTGLIHIAASTPQGRTDYALSLDGVDDGVSVQNPAASLQLGSNITMCAWVNVTGALVGTYATILVKLQTNPAPLSYVMALKVADGRPYVGFGSSRDFYAPISIGASNGWTHLAFTHNGTVGTWYINGQFSSATTNGSIHRYGDAPLLIGRYVDLQDWFNRFPGQLDDIGLWNRTLTQGEIQAVMSNGMSGTESNLVACWNFDDGTAADSTTNFNNGQFLAGATTASRQVAAGITRSASLPSPGDYSFTNIPLANYNVCAYLDSSGNGSNDEWEVHGYYLGNPLSVTGAMDGIDITLHDPVADDDLDRLSDYDEVYVYGSSWTNADTDADGMPDGDEVLAGSQPTNRESVFGFADTQPVPDDNRVVLYWPSLSNRIYRLERSTNLLLGFEPYADGIPADPPVNSYTDDTPNVLGAYKVGVRRE